MSIQSIEQKFTSANSVPVERAMVTRGEWDAVKQMADELAEALEVMKADYEDAKDEWDAENQEYAEGIIGEAQAALSSYRSAKQ